MRRSLKTLVVALAVAFAAPASAALKDGMTLPLAATINGKAGEVFATYRAGQWYIDAGDARRFGGKPDASGAIALEHAEVDVNAMTMRAELPLDIAAATALNSSNRANAPLLKQSFGAWLNYSLDTSRVRGEVRHSLLSDLNVSLPIGGVIRHLQTNDKSGSRRLSTAYTLDLPERMQTVTLGDAYSASYALGGGTKFAGVQLRKNYSLDPAYVYWPTVTLTGAAKAPSVYEIFEGNRKTAGGQLPRGEFSIQDYTSFVGASGDVRLIVKDAQGNEQVITQQLFSAPGVLKPGELAYAVDIGKAYVGQNKLGGLYAAGGVRYGFAGWTGEAGFDTLDGDRSAFFGAVLPTRHGDFSIRRTQGEHVKVKHSKTQVNWERRFFIDSQSEARGFLSVVRDRETVLQGGATYWSGTWSLFAAAQKSDASKTLSFGVSKMFDGWSLSGSMSKSTGSSVVAGMQINIPLGGSTSAFAQVSKDRSGAGAYGEAKGFNWSAATYGKDETTGSVRRDFDRVRAEVYADARDGDVNMRGRFLGSIVATSGGVTLARPVSSSVVLVDTGIAGVPVKAGGREHHATIGKQTVITNLPVYFNSQIQPDFDALEGGYTAVDDRKEIRAPQGVSRVKLAVKAPGFFAAFTHQGKPIERGTLITADGAQVVMTQVGAYIQPDADKETVLIEIGKCKREVTVPKKALEKIMVEVCT